MILLPGFESGKISTLEIFDAKYGKRVFYFSYKSTVLGLIIPQKVLVLHKRLVHHDPKFFRQPIDPFFLCLHGPFMERIIDSI